MPGNAEVLYSLMNFSIVRERLVDITRNLQGLLAKHNGLSQKTTD